MLLVAIALGIAFPLVLFGLRLPRMDDRADSEDQQPLVGWPPTEADLTHMKRLTWVLLALAAVLAILVAAAFLTFKFI
jgi:hypothetical protein